MGIFKNINNIITVVNIVWLLFILIGTYYLLLLITGCDEESFPKEQYKCMKNKIVCAWDKLIKFIKNTAKMLNKANPANWFKK